jgi:outer membrane protein assembly factor BamB
MTAARGRSSLLLALPISLVGLALAGCGGGEVVSAPVANMPSSAPDAASEQSKVMRPGEWDGPTGSIRLAVAWPESSEANVREIPDAAQSIGLRLFLADTGYQLIELPGMDAVPINRPDGAPPWAAQELQITNIPPREIRVEAKAFSLPDAEGDELAVGAVTVTVESEATPGASPTTADLVLGIAELSVAPLALEYNVGEIQKTVTVSNAVDTGPRTLRWQASANRDWITVGPATGVDDGTVTITVDKSGFVGGLYTGAVTIAAEPSIYGVATVTLSVAIQWPGLADSSWPKFHGDRRNTGLNTRVGPATANTRWTFTLDDWMLSSPSIGADGTIYVGSLDGTLYAVNPDGTEQWRYSAGGWIYSTPAVGPDGTIYFGANDSNIYAVNSDGTLKWTFATGSWVASSPALGVDGTIYVGSYDGKVYAINPDGTAQWEFATGSWVFGSPAIGDDGTIYVGSRDTKLYAINADGTKRWEFATGDWVYSSPAVGGDGVIYVGSYDGNLYAVAADGTLLWSFPASAGILSSPAIGADDTVYVGSYDGNLYAIDVNGIEKWRFATGGWVLSSPAVDDAGTIYAGSDDHKLYAIDPSGNKIWEFTVGVGQRFSPAIGPDGALYVGGFDTQLYAIGP